MMDLTPNRPRRSWRRRVFIALVMCFGAGVGLVGLGYWHAGSALRRAMAEAEATDPHWRLADYEEYRTQVPESENSAPLIISGKRIKQTLPRPANENALVAALDEARKYPNHLLNKQELDALTQLDTAYAKAAVEFRKVKDYPRGRFAITYTPDIFGTLLPHVQDARDATRTLQDDCWARIEAGDLATATDDVRAMFNAGRAVGDEPFLISLLVRIACDAISAHSCERLLAMGELDESQLAELQAAVERELAEPLLERALRGERAAGFEAMEFLKRHPGTPGMGWGMGGWERYIGFIPGYVPQQQAALLKTMNKAVAHAHRPIEEQLDLFAAWEAEGKQAPTLARMILPAVSKVGVAAARQQSQFRCLLVAIAAERFRRQNQRWPENIEELVAAKLITAAPTDPFDGKPLRWKVVPEGRIVYSVGQDRTDNGGDLTPDKKTGVAPDQGMRLFDVDKRRAPPRPDKPKEEEGT